MLTYPLTLAICLSVIARFGAIGTSGAAASVLVMRLCLILLPQRFLNISRYPGSTDCDPSATLLGSLFLPDVSLLPNRFLYLVLWDISFCKLNELLCEPLQALDCGFVKETLQLLIARIPICPHSIDLWSNLQLASALLIAN